MNYARNHNTTSNAYSSEESQDGDSELQFMHETNPFVLKHARWFPPSEQRRDYYANFPLEELGQFMNLNRGRDDDLLNRELSFCLRDPQGGIFWSRFRSFLSLKDFHEYLQRVHPVSLNMGALGFSPPPMWSRVRGENRRNAYFETEVMVDVDIKDYDDVRSCNCTGTRMFCQQCPECGKATIGSTKKIFERMCTCEWEKFTNNICLQCWKFAQCGMIIMDYVLRKHWGLVDFFFVFSGMKGFHCWILDDTFRGFSRSQRVAFAATWEPWTDASRSRLKCEKAFGDTVFGKDFDDFLLVLFTEVILGGGIFDIRHVNTRNKIVAYFEMCEIGSEESKLNALMAMCDEFAKQNYDSRRIWKELMDFNFRTNDQVKAKTIQRRFVYAYLFPRIDVAVTTQLNHPRKMPWSPHPRSECIAIPILPLAPERIFEFTPKTAPTVRDIETVLVESGKFAMALDMMSMRLDDVLYCESSFPAFPLMQDLLDLGTESKIFRQLEGWVNRNVTREMLFYEPEHYAYHAENCQTCDATLAVDRENTLLALVIRSSWVDGVYKRVVEETLKLALVRLCETVGFLSVTRSLWERIQLLQAG
jgi:DNA primase small subunit